MKARASELTAIATLIAQGTLKPVIAQVLPFTEIAQAHELSESGRTRGKIALKFD
jgi:NADPH:quinone reductase-like Zn-dependent oxidoreductase